MSLVETPLFMTHHAAWGAWSSLTFGLPGVGVSIDHERLAVENDADLLVGISRGPDQVELFPFFEGAADLDEEAQNLLTTKSPTSWPAIPSGAISRRMSATIDQYSAGAVTLRVYSPLWSIDDPQTTTPDPISLLPSVLLELTIDNRCDHRDAWGILGLRFLGSSRMRPLDWSTDGELCGLAMRGDWALAARAVEGQVFTLRDNNIRRHLEKPTRILHPGGNDGAICFHVPPGESRSLHAAMAFYHPGEASQGISAQYLYTRFFNSLESVCRATLAGAQIIQDRCRAFDAATDRLSTDTRRKQMFFQSVRSYTANTSLLRSEEQVLYSVCEGQFAWRNTLDLAADHLPWELWFQPWVVRNIMDLFISRYSYNDQLRFPGEEEFKHPGGLAFCHDQGNYTAYSPAGRSGYEMTDTRHYCHMTTEQVLNGIYGITSYWLTQNDADTRSRWHPVLEALMTSLENRQSPDPENRKGLLLGESSRCGPGGHEITTYDCHDPSLSSARGNLYIHVKLWCSAILIEACAQQAGDDALAGRAQTLALAAADNLVQQFDAERKAFPSNFLEPGESWLIAAIEPLAVPSFCGLLDQMKSYDTLLTQLTEHTRSCMQPGRTLDPTTGGPRLSSASNNSWPSKTILCFAAAEQVLGIDVGREYAPALEEIRGWMQQAAARRTLSDQIHVSDRKAHSGSYYPRMVTSSLWLCPQAPPIDQ